MFHLTYGQHSRARLRQSPFGQKLTSQVPDDPVDVGITFRNVIFSLNNSKLFHVLEHCRLLVVTSHRYHLPAKLRPLVKTETLYSSSSTRLIAIRSRIRCASVARRQLELDIVTNYGEQFFIFLSKNHTPVVNKTR